MRNRNKYVLVTGAAGFLGTHFCALFLKNGYSVIAVDINTRFLKKKKNLIIYKCDISIEEEVFAMFLKLKQNYFVELLINNAAVDSIPTKVSKNVRDRLLSAKIWDKELNVGLKGSYLMIKYFGEEMVKKKCGNIINIGSDLSVIAPNQNIYKTVYKNFIKPVTYSVIKHGLFGMTKYFASLYANENVKVNMLSPGPIFNNQNKKFVNELKKIIPMKKIGKKKDLDSAILFLADKKNEYFTGQNLLVDGGRTII